MVALNVWQLTLVADLRDQYLHAALRQVHGQSQANGAGAHDQHLCLNGVHQ